LLEDQGRRALADADHVQPAAATDVDQAPVQHFRTASGRHLGRRFLRQRQGRRQACERQEAKMKMAHHEPPDQPLV